MKAFPDFDQPSEGEPDSASPPSLFTLPTPLSSGEIAKPSHAISLIANVKQTDDELRQRGRQQSSREKALHLNDLLSHTSSNGSVARTTADGGKEDATWRASAGVPSGRRPSRISLEDGLVEVGSFRTSGDGRDHQAGRSAGAAAQQGEGSAFAFEQQLRGVGGAEVSRGRGEGERGSQRRGGASTAAPGCAALQVVAYSRPQRAGGEAAGRGVTCGEARSNGTLQCLRDLPPSLLFLRQHSAVTTDCASSCHFMSFAGEFPPSPEADASPSSGGPEGRLATPSPPPPAAPSASDAAQSGGPRASPGSAPAAAGAAASSAGAPASSGRLSGLLRPAPPLGPRLAAPWGGRGRRAVAGARGLPRAASVEDSAAGSGDGPGPAEGGGEEASASGGSSSSSSRMPGEGLLRRLTGGGGRRGEGGSAREVLGGWWPVLAGRRGRRERRAAGGEEEAASDGGAASHGPRPQQKAADPPAGQLLAVPCSVSLDAAAAAPPNGMQLGRKLTAVEEVPAPPAEGPPSEVPAGSPPASFRMVSPPAGGWDVDGEGRAEQTLPGPGSVAYPPSVASSAAPAFPPTATASFQDRTSSAGASPESDAGQRRVSCGDFAAMTPPPPPRSRVSRSGVLEPTPRLSPSQQEAWARGLSPANAAHYQRSRAHHSRSPRRMYPKSSSFTATGSASEKDADSPQVSPSAAQPGMPRSASQMSPPFAEAPLRPAPAAKQGSPMTASPASAAGSRRASISDEHWLADSGASGMDMWHQLGRHSRQRGAALGSVAISGRPAGGRAADPEGPEEAGARSPLHAAAAAALPPVPALEPPPGGPPHRSPRGEALPPALAAVQQEAAADSIRMSFGDEFQPRRNASRSVWQAADGGRQWQRREGPRGAAGQPAQPTGRSSVGSRLSLDLFGAANAGGGEGAGEATSPDFPPGSPLGGWAEASTPLPAAAAGGEVPGRSAPTSPFQAHGAHAGALFPTSNSFKERTEWEQSLRPQHRHRHSPQAERDLRSPRFAPSQHAGGAGTPVPWQGGAAAREHSHSATASPLHAWGGHSSLRGPLLPAPRGKLGGHVSGERRVRRAPAAGAGADTDVEDEGGGEAGHAGGRPRLRVNNRVAANSDRAVGSRPAEVLAARQAAKQSRMHLQADDTLQRQLVANYAVEALSKEQLARLLMRPGGEAQPLPAAESGAGAGGHAAKGGVAVSRDGGAEGEAGGGLHSKKSTSTRRAAADFKLAVFPALRPRGGAAAPHDHVLQRPYEAVGSRFALSKEELGSGQYGVIRRCMEIDSGKIFACKTIKKSSIRNFSEAEDIRKEVACLKMLQPHPHIVELKAAFEDEKHVHIVMELCRGGDLFDRLVSRGPMTEANGAALCRALVEALLHCHSHHCVHRDIKPENILMQDKVSDTRIKVVDFGIATFCTPGARIRDVMGTPEYMAPEQILGCYGPEADIWAAGVVTYMVMCALPPFWASDRDGVKRAIVEKEVSFRSPKWANVSEECKDLVARMLVKDPGSRITGADVLGHPWIRRWCSGQ